MLSKRKVLFVIYNIDAMVNVHTTLHNTYTSTMRTESEINFVVLCRINCVKRVLNMVRTLSVSNKLCFCLMTKLIAFYEYDNL